MIRKGLLHLLESVDLTDADKLILDGSPLELEFHVTHEIVEFTNGGFTFFIKRPGQPLEIVDTFSMMYPDMFLLKDHE